MELTDFHARYLAHELGRARNDDPDLCETAWELSVIDEAHRLRSDDREQKRESK